MKSQSSQPPDAIWFRNKTQTQQLVRLTRNVEEVHGEDEDGNPTTHYVYDYIDVTLPLTSGLRQYVEDNFDAIWEAHDAPTLYQTMRELHAENTALESRNRRLAYLLAEKAVITERERDEVLKDTDAEIRKS